MPRYGDNLLSLFFQYIWMRIQGRDYRAERKAAWAQITQQAAAEEAAAAQAAEDKQRAIAADAMQKVLADKEQRDAQHSRPWEQIPESDWGRAAVKMMCEGLTNKEIAHELSKDEKTIANKLSQLRANYLGIPSRNRRTSGGNSQDT